MKMNIGKKGKMKRMKQNDQRVENEKSLVKIIQLLFSSMSTPSKQI